MLSEPMLALTDSRRSLPPPSTLKNALNLDFVWMLSQCHCVPNTSMSTGWNSRIVKDVLPLQRVRYLPQIDASPTRVDVVKETMEKSLRITTTLSSSLYIYIVIVHHSKTSQTRSNLDDFKLSIQDANKILQIKPFIA